MRRKAGAAGGGVARGVGPRSAAAGSRRAVIRQAGSYGQWARPRNLARSPGGSGDWGCSRKRRSLAARETAGGAAAVAGDRLAHGGAGLRLRGGLGQVGDVGGGVLFGRRFFDPETVLVGR